MNCEKAQNLILTDHIDERSTGAGKAALEAHLAGCAGCREFLAMAQRTLVDPFRELPREEMPSSVMNAIMDHVREKEESRGYGWLEGIREWAFPSLPLARVFATLLVCFLVAGTVLGVNSSQQARQNERVLFLAQVADISADKGRGMSDYGTAMESYFLTEGGNS